MRREALAVPQAHSTASMERLEDQGGPLLQGGTSKLASAGSWQLTATARLSPLTLSRAWKYRTSSPGVSRSIGGYLRA